ncbi:hypothetical protein HD806DRAFT_489972 [Xylariaceae sp. AK1471]|nr:hypothetical protein HD806DRAFT_489972 [Xylariaceae sp. AK1471]
MHCMMSLALHALVVILRLYCSGFLVFHLACANLLLAPLITPLPRHCGNSGSSHVFNKRDGQTPSTSNQHLSNEAIIGIVALVAAVIVVPIVSKYCTHWLAHRHRQSVPAKLTT